MAREHDESLGGQAVQPTHAQKRAWQRLWTLLLRDDTEQQTDTTLQIDEDESPVTGQQVQFQVKSGLHSPSSPPNSHEAAPHLTVVHVGIAHETGAETHETPPAPIEINERIARKASRRAS